MATILGRKFARHSIVLQEVAFPATASSTPRRVRARPFVAGRPCRSSGVVFMVADLFDSGV